MDSSILELQQAITNLTDFNQRWAPDQVHGADSPGIAHLYQICNNIARSFEGVNNSLSEGWTTAAKVFYEISRAVGDTLHDAYEGIKLFTDETYQAELAAQKAVENVTDIAQKILDELKGMGFSSYAESYGASAAAVTGAAATTTTNSTNNVLDGILSRPKNGGKPEYIPVE